MKRVFSIFAVLLTSITLLQAQSVTVLGNYAPVLPLTSGEIAVLSIGTPGSDQLFLNAIHAETPADTYQITDQTTEEEYKTIAGELQKYRRVVISITGETVDMRPHRKFLSSLNTPAPLVYTIFSSYRMLHLLANPLEKAAAVVLTHDLSNELQEQAARIIFGKEEINGKLTMAVGDLFPEGSGVTLPEKNTTGIVTEDYGIKSYILNRKADLLIQKSIQDTVFPGCQLLILKDGQPIFDKCYGTFSYDDPTPVTPQTIYDLSELSQSAGTLLAVMKLYDEGKLSLNDKASAYLPALRATNKKDITIKELLLHESGLVPYIRFYEQIVDDKTVQGPFFQGFIDDHHYTRTGARTYACSNFSFKKEMISPYRTNKHNLQMTEDMWVNDNIKEIAIQAFIRSEMKDKRYLPGSSGFIVLQQVIEKISATSLDQYLCSNFYEPMGLSRTLYLPLQRYGKEEIAPTATNEYLRRQDIHGYVHDEAAACLGGVSGNAGLFSTAHEVAQIFTMLLNKGMHNGKRYLSEETCNLFITEKSATEHQGLGFEKPNTLAPHLSFCSLSTPPEVFGKTGFSGSCAWADPVNNIVFVLLSNSICPEVWNDKIVWNKLREKIQGFIYQSMEQEHD